MTGWLFPDRFYTFPQQELFIHPHDLDLILDNLSDNAAKYSFEGGTIEIWLDRKKMEGKEYIKYSISNYGNGIDESERFKIGQKGYRGKWNSTVNTRNEGTGFGVYTIKTLVEQAKGIFDWHSGHGGDINYFPGEGFLTTFYIWLPIEKTKDKRSRL